MVRKTSYDRSLKSMMVQLKIFFEIWNTNDFFFWHLILITISVHCLEHVLYKQRRIKSKKFESYFFLSAKTIFYCWSITKGSKNNTQQPYYQFQKYKNIVIWVNSVPRNFE